MTLPVIHFEMKQAKDLRNTYVSQEVSSPITKTPKVLQAFCHYGLSCWWRCLVVVSIGIHRHSELVESAWIKLCKKLLVGYTACCFGDPWLVQKKASVFTRISWDVTEICFMAQLSFALAENQNWTDWCLLITIVIDVIAFEHLASTVEHEFSVEYRHGLIFDLEKAAALSEKMTWWHRYTKQIMKHHVDIGKSIDFYMGILSHWFLQWMRSFSLWLYRYFDAFHTWAHTSSNNTTGWFWKTRCSI